MKRQGGKVKIVFVALKLLWKRKLANLVLILEIVLSVIMLAQLFVFVADHIYNVRAVNELPQEHTAVLSVYDYYDPEDVARRIREYPQAVSVDIAYTGTISFNNELYNLAVYSEGIVENYAPKLQSGVWLSDCPGIRGDGVPAVISADMGLSLGETVEVFTPQNKRMLITVAGILKEPAQYLFPSGGASSASFSADMIISQNPVFIIRESDYEDTAALLPAPEMNLPQNLFVFLKPDISEDEMEKAVDPWRKYGEVTPIASLVSVYSHNASRLIGGGAAFFFVFFCLAATCLISNNAIQSLRNRRLFTVYYLLGMDWKMGAVIEAVRAFILILISMILCVLAGKYGLLMLEWLSPRDTYLFYGAVLVYLIAMFTAFGAGFLIKLSREDISAALKDLQQGE